MKAAFDFPHYISFPSDPAKNNAIVSFQPVLPDVSTIGIDETIKRSYGECTK